MRDALLRRAIDAKAGAANEEDDLQRLGQKIFFSGGVFGDIADVARKRAALHTGMQMVQECLQEMDSIGVQVKDLETGFLEGNPK